MRTSANNGRATQLRGCNINVLKKPYLGLGGTSPKLHQGADTGVNGDPHT